MAFFARKISEIDDSLSNLRESCLYDEGLTRRITAALIGDSLSHSDAIEENSSSQVTLKRLEEAWNFAVVNINEDLSHSSICDIAAKVEPINHSYRTDNVLIPGFDRVVRSGVRPIKIRREMNNLIYHIKDESNQDAPSLKAAEISLYGLFIHPFQDGNGRTFRLLHNLLLYKNGIPPVVIRKSEKRPYKMLIAAAQDGFNERVGQADMFSANRSFGEMNYFGFMLDKVQESIEELSGRYTKFRMYDVECYFKGNGKQLHGVREMLRRGCTAGGWVFKSSLDLPKRTVRVVTDAPFGIVNSNMLNYTKDRSWFKGYELIKRRK